MKTNWLILLAMVFTLSCQNPKSHSHETEQAEEAGAHEHEHAEGILLTQYTDSFELFAECSPFVAGEEAEILGHFTRLPEFKPLQNGEITAELFIEGKKVATANGSPVQTGIFDFDLEPTRAGKGHLVFSIKNEGQIEVPIEVFADEQEAEHAAHEAEIDNPNAVVFPKEKSWEIDFATTPVRFEPFGEVIKSTAKVEPASGQEMTHAAGMSGFVNYELSGLAEGITVPAGRAVLSISEKNRAENSMAVKYEEAKNNYESAKANYERISKLAGEKIVSQARLQEAERDYRNARAQYENLQKNYREGKQVISCKSAGYIKKLLVQNGQFVEAGTPLFVMAHNESLFLKAAVAQRYTNALSRLNDAVIKCPGCRHNISLAEVNGQVVSVGQSLSEAGFMVPVTLKIDRHEDLLPGSLVEVLLKTTSNQPVISVPNSALLEEQGNFSVYVQLTPELFEKRGVQTGASDGLFTEIKSGLQPGERVVSKGAILIKLSAASGKLDPHAGHVH